jgi:c-di-GMP phosphodiesterase
MQSTQAMQGLQGSQEQSALGHPVLGQVALGYSPMIDRQRSVVSTRLTVFPQSPDAAPDARALLRAIEEVWPPQGSPDATDGELAPLRLDPRPLDPSRIGQAQPSNKQPLVSLNLAGEALLRGVMAAEPGPHFMLEVPAFMATDPSITPALRRLHRDGTVLLIKGRPSTPLSPEVLAYFAHSIVDAADDRRTGTAAPAQARSITHVQSGARSLAEVDAAFQRGAVAVLGWPWDDSGIAPQSNGGRGSVPSDVATVMELIQGVEKEDPVQKLEAVLRRDPTLGFRLMRYLNSAAFGLRVELNSFSHALMMLGYQRLKRWLALLLASSVKGANAKPVMYAAVRRGLLMEELGRDQGDAEMRGEMFICGVFSLLDRMLQQPMADLLNNVPVPERVQQALLGEGGPFGEFLKLVQAIEQEAVFDIREQSEQLLLSPQVVNRALLVALRGARELDG